MKKIAKICLIFAVCLTVSVLSVNAKSYIKSLFRAGDNVTIKEELDGTAFIAGNNVNINKSINGIAFVAANNLKIKDNQEYVIAAGGNVELSGKVEKDLFLAGQNIESKDFSVGRDSYIFGDIVKLDGDFNRNIYISAGEVVLNGTYNGNITISATNIKVVDGVKINGTLKYNEDATINKLDKDIKTKTYVNATPKVSFIDYLKSVLLSYLKLLIIALVLALFFENIYKASLKQTKDKSFNGILGLCGKGLLILIGVPILALSLMVTGVFSSIGIIALLIYGIFVYISSIFSGYYLATMLDKKYFHKNLNNYWLLIIGILLIYILRMLPFVGGLVLIVSATLSLGILGNMVLELKK